MGSGVMAQAREGARRDDMPNLGLRILARAHAFWELGSGHHAQAHDS
jgi:hypothetical protein